MPASESVPAVPSRAVLTAADRGRFRRQGWPRRSGQAGARWRRLGWLAVESGLAAGTWSSCRGMPLKDGDPVTVVDEPSPEPGNAPGTGGRETGSPTTAPTDQAALQSSQRGGRPMRMSEVAINRPVYRHGCWRFWYLGLAFRLGLGLFRTYHPDCRRGCPVPAQARKVGSQVTRPIGDVLMASTTSMK